MTLGSVRPRWSREGEVYCESRRCNNVIKSSESVPAASRGWDKKRNRTERDQERNRSLAQTEREMSNASLTQLLQQADHLARLFTAQHSASLSAVQSLQSATNQHSNLSNLPSSTQLRSQGLLKVQQVIEDALDQIRQELQKMETTVEQLGSLLYRADIFLANPESVLANGLNPHQALTHVSQLFSSYQAELIRLREVLSDFTCEEIGVGEFYDEWRVMKEVDQGKEIQLRELVDVMSRWAGTTSLDDMFA